MTNKQELIKEINDAQHRLMAGVRVLSQYADAYWINEDYRGEMLATLDRVLNAVGRDGEDLDSAAHTLCEGVRNA